MNNELIGVISNEGELKGVLEDNSFNVIVQITETGPRGPQGPEGPQGPQGEKGDKGDDGRGIVSIVRTAGTGAAGTYDTYTISFTDGSTTTYQVYNGKDGAKGDKGDPGPNEISSETATEYNGLLKGDGEKVVVAEAGTDYATPSNVADAISDHDSDGSAHSALFDNKLDKSGGTMTGSLILVGDPTQALEAATKQYVDELVGDIEALLASI